MRLFHTHPAQNEGVLRLELTTDLRGHAWLCAIDSQAISEILLEALRKLDELGKQDPRTYRD